jgi:DNA-binding NtrC family response regulator
MQAHVYHILFVTDGSGVEQKVISMLQDSEDQSFSVRKMALSPHISTHLSFCKWDAVLWDLSNPAEQDLDTLKNACRGGNSLPVIGLVAEGQNQLGRMAMKLGAVDYLPTNVLRRELLVRALHYAIERNRANVAAGNPANVGRVVRDELGCAIRINCQQQERERT